MIIRDLDAFEAFLPHRDLVIGSERYLIPMDEYRDARGLSLHDGYVNFIGVDA